MSDYEYHAYANPENFKNANDLAQALSEDYVNYRHALNRAAALMNQGWRKDDRGREDVET